MRLLFWIGCLSYLLIGCAHVVLGSLLPVMLDYYGLDYRDGGTLVFVQFAGFMVGVLLSPYLIGKFGKRRGLIIALVLLSIAELVYTFLPPWGWMYVTAFAAGMSFGTIESVIGTIIIAGITEQTAVAMSRLEVFFGVGALSMPLLSSWFIQIDIWRCSFLIISLIGVIAAVLWARGSFGSLSEVLDQRKADLKTAQIVDQASRMQPSYSKKMNKKTVSIIALFIGFFFLYVGIETSLINFIPSILIEKLHLKESSAALSVTIFWVAMSIGRIFAGVIAEKIQYGVYVLASCIGAIILFALFPTSQHSIISFVIILLLGIALSGLFSIALVFVNKLLPGSEESTTSIMIASGAAGGAVLPLMIGWSMDLFSANTTAWLLALFAACMLVLSFAAFVTQRRHRVVQEIPNGM
ncbi:MFS transporter [Paenibacillus sediminis]|uniref:FHS family glucose/mannose:H+ symporter-like MFS transporter n=1 Tax=Paenibacillus sediminis TaxID=664909 RepID=A0ABS4H194_9BACL|nr:MFS transporter [Paenibacillus sediminis]MBP1936298.1 FHS family glucose/mannose:H+ symporter-like MFS transporter [Paenibacillus sediminis]